MEACGKNAIFRALAIRKAAAGGRVMSGTTGEAMALLYCPCPGLDAAKRLGNALLDRRLAGCINILPAMVSLYDWEGRREEAAEVVLLAKTSAGRAAEARAFLEREHPYDIPAVLVFALADMNAPYRDWLLRAIGGAGLGVS
jgi:periplasmic divalent cation tolerance protein